jgi:hypothetical protein
MSSVSFFDADGKINPRVPLPDGGFADMMVTEPETPGEEARVMWLPAGAMVDLYGKLAKGGHKPTYANVRSFLSEMPNVQGYDDGFFLRGGKVEYGPAKPKPAQASVGVGVPFLDRRFAGVGNALVRGTNNVLSAYDGRALEGSLADYSALADAKGGKAGQPEVTDAYHEAAKAGLPMPDDPAAVLADIVAGDTTKYRKTPGPVMGSSYGNYVPQAIYPTDDPRHKEALKNKENADNLVRARSDYQGRVNKQQSRRESGVSLFKEPPASAEFVTAPDGGYGLPDSRVAGDYGMSLVAKYVLSLTPEQRAAMTDQQIQAKVDELLSGEVSADLTTASKSLGQSDARTRYWSPVSEPMKTFNKEGNNYDDVYDEHGVLGVANTMFQQLAESTPNTVATAGATAAASLASGPAAPFVGRAAMGLSTAALGAGTNFNQAFGKFLGDNQISLADLADPSSPAYAKASADLKALIDKDPAAFFGQTGLMKSEAEKRAMAEGLTAVALNIAGDKLTGLAKNALPKSLQGSGSVLAAARSIPFRPVETFRGGIYKKILLPRAINASIDTWWEATEEGLTDIITNVIMGDDVDLKTALSSFMVGGLMGGGSSFGAGKANIDDPFQIIKDKAAAGESGLDEVAAEIEKNTGMPAARAKAAINRAAELLDQFETFAKRYPPNQRAYAWKHFMSGYRGSQEKFVTGVQDKTRATMKDKENALAALREALENERLMAIRPNKVPVNPLIPSLQSDVDRIKQIYPAATGEGRYYPPLYDPTSSRSGQGE